MRNVCIVLKKSVTVEGDGANAVLNAFYLGGYAFDELRILTQTDVKALRESVTALNSACDNLLVLADKTALPIVKEQILGLLQSVTPQMGFGEAGIYNDKNFSLFVLSADATETGVDFVKNACIPFLCRKYGVRFEETVVRSVGANEARVQSLLAEADKLGGGKIGIRHTRKYDEDVIGIVYDSNSPKMLVDGAIRLFADGLGDTVYALNDVSLEEQLVTLLKLRGRKLSVAESFTGGGITRRITSVSGASEVYFEGLNTYDEASKKKRLGVTDYTLKAMGAVSDQTAYEMAAGLLDTGDCDVAIATTGLAGPKSDRSMLPVGLCYIAVGVKERIFVYRYKFDGDRKEITEKAINYALFLAYKQLKDIS